MLVLNCHCDGCSLSWPRHSAGATQISVTVHEGGLKLLQIKDNGSGINPDDLPILCHRHTTSKISTFEDVAAVSTLGFRGEALCSISFVARLSVTSMQPGAEMGFKADFRDSQMVQPEPEACAAVPGTVMQVEDMFYNVPNRKKAMKSASEEFKRVFDVVARYSIFSCGASRRRACTVHKLGESAPTRWRLQGSASRSSGTSR